MAAARHPTDGDDLSVDMDIVFRATVAFFFILLLTRIVGRRELSSMEPFDLILLVVIGDLVQQGVTQSDYSFTGLLIAVSTFGLLAIAVSYASFRVRFLRPVLDGEPIIIVREGQVIESNLRRERITEEELLAEARQQQIGRLDEIRWAVLETSGQISFVKKSS
jgi:uncharacterized membrane protein YcaP (DUF421 family)